MARRSVDFSTVQNTPAKFLLEDGTEILIQLVMLRIHRTDEKLPDGQFKHELQMQTIMDQAAPEGEIDVRKLTGQDK